MVSDLDIYRAANLLIERYGTNALIEYSHRFTASLVFILVAGLAVVAWWRYRRVRRVMVPATAPVLAV